MTTAMRRDRIVPVEFRPCRTYQHAWDPTTVKQDGRHLVQGLICLRCKTIRKQKIDSRTGERLGNSYEYPDGYVLPGGGGALSARERGMLRLAEVKTHIRS